MATKEAFFQQVQKGYSFKGESAKIGTAMFEKAVVSGADVNIPFKTLNRHGLIAGATGTGKTKTLQVIAEILSDASIPVVMMDIKGDLSGIGAAGTTNDAINNRCKLLNIEFTPQKYPIEFLSLSEEKGVKLKATVTEFGPVLLSKILALNDTQGSIVSMIFKYCDDKKWPLLDLKDFIKVLQYICNEGKTEMVQSYGNISTSSTGTILRKVIELQQQGADNFFGEPTFEVEDLTRINEDGRGMINILRVTDMQTRPKLFSTFMLELLAELYATFPEEGDMEKPKLIMFIDEAHLLFEEATSALLNQLETVIKLIRSKGIGIYFCTQNPTDVPAPILAQLGLKIQHALRAFTAADRKAIKQTAENFPLSDFYKTDELLTQVGIGEALITLLNEKGIPTPLVHTMLRPPHSRMDILSTSEIDSIVAQSKLVNKYNITIDNKSAYEILNQKLEAAEKESEKEKEKETETKTKERKKEKPGFFDSAAIKQIERTAASIITRSLLGALGIKSRRKRLW